MQSPFTIFRMLEGRRHSGSHEVLQSCVIEFKDCWGANLTGKEIDFALYPAITISVCGFKIVLIRRRGEDHLLLILNLRSSV